MSESLYRIVKADGKNELQLIRDMKKRAGTQDYAVTEAVLAILNDVKQNGFSAVTRYSQQFDHEEPREISAAELQKAYDACPKDLITALQDAAENICIYHEQMRQKSWTFEREPGAVTGQLIAPLERVGIYVPGGTAAYPSSVLMNAIPAKVAGVREIIMVTPPGKNMNNAVLAAAKIAGVDRVMAVGGVQAIAALAYGAGFIPKVDKITGPGNAYVATAKKMVFGTVDIDMVAGPSEVLVIADETANPSYVAADLLSQAEHDVLASAILLTTSLEAAEKIAVEIQNQTQRLKRKEIIQKSLCGFGAAIVCRDMAEVCALANLIAPEHLEIVTEDPHAVLPHIKNAGAVFLGSYSPEPLGDYMAGPCHVLPTSGTARFSSPLSVDSFIKKTSVIEYSKECLMKLADEIEILANAEGLTAHANSIRVRKNS